MQVPTAHRPREEVAAGEAEAAAVKEEVKVASEEEEVVSNKDAREEVKGGELQMKVTAE